MHRRCLAIISNIAQFQEADSVLTQAQALRLSAIERISLLNLPSNHEPQRTAGLCRVKSAVDRAGVSLHQYHKVHKVNLEMED